MFHFPTFPPHALCVQARVTPHDWCGVPPFGHPRINARLAAPRGLSQPPTSFIGSWCPGIHRVPLTTWPHNYNTPHTHPGRSRRTRTPNPTGALRGPAIKEDARVHCAVLNDQPATIRTAPPTPTRPPPPVTPRLGGTRTRTAPTETTDPPGRGRSASTPRRARSLRTQQRAYDPPPPRPRSPHPPPTGDAAPY
jgi:hypothetical protein